MFEKFLREFREMLEKLSLYLKHFRKKHKEFFKNLSKIVY